MASAASTVSLVVAPRPLHEDQEARLAAPLEHRERLAPTSSPPPPLFAPCGWAGLDGIAKERLRGGNHSMVQAALRRDVIRLTTQTEAPDGLAAFIELDEFDVVARRLPVTVQ